MAPKKARQEKKPPPTDPEGMFGGMVVFLVGKGVQPRRLQIWKQKLMQMGAVIEDKFKKMVTHIFAMNSETVMLELGIEKLKHFKGSILPFEWLENSLKLGEKLSEDSYALRIALEEESGLDEPVVFTQSAMLNGSHFRDDSLKNKRTRISSDDLKAKHDEVPEDGKKMGEQGNHLSRSEDKKNDLHSREESQALKEDTGNQICGRRSTGSVSASAEDADTSKELSSLYNPPDLNRNITVIFGKFINIYRALGDDRRSFSYHKAIPVIEKLPFKIESVDQVKHLPAIGKSMQDHIHEIVTTGNLSKLEHFESDEKVRTVTLFGEVWGIGPATALKLYEKGHRTLDDLGNEESLTNAQRLGVKYFSDIKQKIPREEVKEMEALLREAGEAILPRVIIVCGGSYRRGKALCGDLDIVITHPDGQSHKGFLAKYVKYLKDISFLREDLVFSTHSEEGTDSGVDTYFGLCTYPGRDQRHRIDFKVYPRDIYAYGLIAWTGNDVLNRRLRLLAESKGYRLDDTGLFLATQGSHVKKGVKSSTSIHCQTEREVFDLLGFPWLEPHERNL